MKNMDTLEVDRPRPKPADITPQEPSQLAVDDQITVGIVEQPVHELGIDPSREKFPELDEVLRRTKTKDATDHGDAPNIVPVDGGLWYDSPDSPAPPPHAIPDVVNTGDVIVNIEFSSEFKNAYSQQIREDLRSQLRRKQTGQFKSDQEEREYAAELRSRRKDQALGKYMGTQVYREHLAKLHKSGIENVNPREEFIDREDPKLFEVVEGEYKQETQPTDINDAEGFAKLIVSGLSDEDRALWNTLMNKWDAGEKLSDVEQQDLDDLNHAISRATPLSYKSKEVADRERQEEDDLKRLGIEFKKKILEEGYKPDFARDELMIIAKVAAERKPATFIKEQAREMKKRGIAENNPRLIASALELEIGYIRWNITQIGKQAPHSEPELLPADSAANIAENKRIQQEIDQFKNKQKKLEDLSSEEENLVEQRKTGKVKMDDKAEPQNIEGMPHITDNDLDALAAIFGVSGGKNSLGNLIDSFTELANDKKARKSFFKQVDEKELMHPDLVKLIKRQLKRAAYFEKGKKIGKMLLIIFSMGSVGLIMLARSAGKRNKGQQGAGQ